MKCGVRQRGLTSPVLFNLYINDLIEELSSAAVGCHIAGNFSYADDMALLSPSVNGMTILLDICSRYAACHGLKYKVKKTQVVVFKFDKGPDVIQPMLLDGVELEIASSFEYLGHILTHNLKGDEDLERQRRMMSVKSNMLAPRFTKCSGQVKITLFKRVYSC
ncbi:hypothetical protein MSG28_011507 [Choristoneura fumiferana]|uniref:Uncharacterized protein n=1 Tax=Choristoneura fumiferana TaxID=7141 RepID=A0ACC0JNL6_CHOFU|nr:hypothetical protein MSG28_011507 [Choristoneura fumiferana]